MARDLQNHLVRDLKKEMEEERVMEGGGAPMIGQVAAAGAEVRMAGGGLHIDWGQDRYVAP